MTKSAIAAIAAFAVVAVFAGTYAYVNKPATETTQTEQTAPPAKSDPFNDCVHSAFPQCSDNQVK